MTVRPRRFPVMVLLAAAVALEACSGTDHRTPPGVLGLISGPHLAQLAPDGNTLYYTVGEIAYPVDVSDPRRPRPRTGMAGANGLFCNPDAGCPGFAVEDPIAYFVDNRAIQRVLLSADSVLWEYDYPTVPDHYTNYVVPLPSGALAIAGYRQDTYAGDLLFVSTSSGVPSEVSSIVDTASDIHFISSDGSRIFYVEDNDGLPGNPPQLIHRAAVVDASDIAAPQEVSRIDLPGLPEGDEVFFFAARAHDLFAGAQRNGGLIWLEWCRYSEDYRSLEFIDALPRWSLANPQPVLTSDGYVLFTVDGTDADPYDLAAPERLVVLRLDTAAGLVEASLTPLSVFPRAIAVDEQRGLVYVGGYGLEIFDLGILEGGPARWP